MQRTRKRATESAGADGEAFRDPALSPGDCYSSPMSQSESRGRKATDSQSTGSETTQSVTPEECGDWRRTVRDGKQSRRDIARRVQWTRTTVIKHVGGHEDCPHSDDPAPVRQSDGGPGIHDADSEVVREVAAELDDRLKRNFGDTVNTDAGALREACGIQAGQAVTAALCALADDGSEFGLDVERTNPGANQPHWAVRRVEGDSS